MSEPTQRPSDEEIIEKAIEFSKQMFALKGRGNGAGRDVVGREWIRYLQSLKKNSLRTVARNAYWVEYDRLNSDG